MDFSDQIAGR